MILQFYAPRNDATEEDKGEFYELQAAKEISGYQKTTSLHVLPWETLNPNHEV